MKRIIAKGLVFGLLLSQLFPGVGMSAEAAKRKVKLNKKSVTIRVGKRVKLKVKNKKKSAKVTWKSKNKKIASVNKKGNVTGKKVGKTKIVCLVKQGKKKTKLTCKVTVKKDTSTIVPTGNPKVTAEPTATPKFVGILNPTKEPMPTQTPVVKPGEDYHTNWPSLYTDDYLPLQNLATSFKIGSAIAGSSEELSALYDADMVGILQKHYNTTTLTNLMKPIFLLDEAASKASVDGMPAVSFESCDRALKFCQDTGIQMRGHVLVWYNQTPDWFFHEDYDVEKDLVDKATMQARMESYIKQVITYVQTNYPEVVYCWDVVNEAVDDEGEIRSSNNMWYTVYAEGNEGYNEYEYVKDAFTYAKKYANPEVKLVYNDYNTFDPWKRVEILRMIEYVNANGTLIDTIGMQCPILQKWPYIMETADTIYGEDSCVEHAIEDFAKADLEIMITELCVRTNGGNTKSEMETQAQRYKEMYQLLWDMDKENGGQAQITSVTTFGISDSYRLYPESNWQAGDESRYAWLFDKNCKAKLAFKSVYNVFANANGKPIVEEVYEKPEGQGDEVETHIVSGKATMKNGTPMKNQMVIFHSAEEYYYCTTDEEGKYSISLPNGSFSPYIKGFGVGESFSMTADMPETVEKDVTLLSSWYQVEGKIISQNGTPIANKGLSFSYPSEEWGEDWIDIETDENGAFSMYMEEYTYTGEDSLVEGVTFTIDKEYNAENPLIITVDKNMYEVSGAVEMNEFTLANEDSYFDFWFSEIDGDASGAVSICEEDEYSIALEEGTYQVRGAYYEYEEIRHTIYYGTLEVNQNMTFDFKDANLHQVVVETSCMEGASSIYALDVGEMNIAPWSGDAYIANNETGTLEGKFSDEDAEGNVYGLYQFTATYDLTDAKAGEKLVISEGIQRIDQVLIPGKEYDYVLCGEMSDYEDYEEEENYAYDNVEVSFVPEESGTYTFYTKHEDVPEDEEKYSEISLQFFDSKRVYQSGRYELGTLDATIDVELEAGKRYFISFDLYQYASLLTNNKISYGIKKVEE